MFVAQCIQNTKWTTHVTIINALGVTSFSGKISTAHHFDISTLELGNYSVTIQVNDNNFSG